jgi:hypothetical protein
VDKKTFYMRTPQARESAIAMIRNLPLSEDKPLMVTVAPFAKVRGLDANAYYWLRLGEIADQAWLEGRQYSAEIWHEYARRNIMPEQVTTKDGETRSKWAELPDGTLSVISTTQLEKRSFADYVTSVEAFAAALGVQFSERPYK